MYKNYKRLVYTPSDLLARICKVNLSNAKKFGLICFPRICFRGLIYCDQEPFWLLNVVEDVCYFLGVHIRLSTRCKMFHSKITYPFPQTSHECALKLTDLWITIQYKFYCQLPMGAFQREVLIVQVMKKKKKRKKKKKVSQVDYQ